MTKLQKALILILLLTIQPEHGHAYRKQADQLPTANTNQFIIFQEIGEMAADLSYIHVTLPLNISTLYQQAEVFESYLTDLANFTTDKMNRIPFAKAVRDAGQIGLRSLNRIVTNLQDIDYNLVHSKDKRRKKRDLLHDALLKEIRNSEQLIARRKDWAQRAIWRKQYSEEDLDNYNTKLYINSTLDNIQKLLNKPKREHICLELKDKLLHLEKYATTKDDNKVTYVMVPYDHPTLPFPYNLEDRIKHYIKVMNKAAGKKIDLLVKKQTKDPDVKYELILENDKYSSEFIDTIKQLGFKLNKDTWTYLLQ